MGYNNRALRLRDAARRIVGELGGVFPDDLQVLRSIKGLGHYTAAAIRNFAFNIPTPCLDTNIRRILHRTFVGPERADGSFRVGDRKLLKLAEEVLKVAVTSDVVRCSLARCSTIDQTSNQQRINEQPPRDAANWHAALMDFGALVQTKKDPKWDECPLTARGLMKATPKNSPKSAVRTPKSEPGRQIAGRFVPNRIVRGRIVEALRYAPSGLTLDALGGRVAADWSAVRHRAWLRGILASLERDALITRRARRFALRE
jgi:A/G-specific adenine glycosylase